MMPPETPKITPPMWRPIEDLPEGWERLHTDQLRSLGDVWRRQREAQLDDSAVLREFNERLSRQWAIETGIIEGLYTIDRGTTQVLIEHGILEKNIPYTVTNRPLTLVAMLQDHQMVLEGAFDFVQQRRSLSTSYIKEIHAALTQHQPTTEAIDSLGRIATVELLRGEWKRHANNPTRPDGLVHPYCPPEHVAAEMDRLIAMHLAHIELRVAPEVEAAWLHHRFTQIHPFQDGNGRVARVLASLVFLRAGWFPLTIDRDQRGAYIDALELADRGMLAGLIRLFAKVQELEFFNAFVELDKMERIEPARSPVIGVDTVVPDALADIASARAETLRRTWGNSSARGDRSLDIISIERSGSSYEPGYGFATVTTVIGRQLGYEPNTVVYGKWIRLSVENQIRWRIFLSVHGFGRRFIGLCAVSAIILGEDSSHSSGFGLATLIGPDPLVDSVFMLAQDEFVESVVSRFEEWLDVVFDAASNKLRVLS